MKTFLILIFAFHLIIGWGQNERHLKEYFKRSKFIGASHKLKKYEPKISKKERQVLFDRFANWGKWDKTRDYGFWGDSSEVHFINLNGDNFVDVVYTNSLGLDDASFYYGAKDSFRLVLKAPPPNFIKELKFEEETCTEVILESIPYVDAVHSEMVYKLVKDSFELHSWRWNMDCSFIPSKYFKNAVNIKTKIEACPIREKPQIGNGECFYEEGDEFYNKSSNIIGRFKKGSRGISWAEKRDENGILWNLVEMPLIDEISTKEADSRKYSKEEYFIGWMQVEHLERIQ